MIPPKKPRTRLFKSFFLQIQYSLISLPAMAKVVLNAKGIHDFHRLVVDQILNRLRVVVKGGDRGDDLRPDPGQFQQVFQVNFTQWGFAGDND